MPRKQNNPDVEACVALLFEREPTAKKVRWQALWQQYMERDKHQTAHPTVAELLTFMGACQAFEDAWASEQTLHATNTPNPCPVNKPRHAHVQNYPYVWYYRTEVTIP